MAINNPVLYGIRFHKSKSGSRNMPDPEVMFVETSQSFDVNGGASNVGLGKWDPVAREATGGAILAVGAETTAVAIYGICVGVLPSYDSTIGNSGQMSQRNTLPADLAWGTNLNRQSRIQVVRADSCIWEVDVNNNTTATTQAAYEAFVGENCDHILTGASGDAFNATRAVPLLDITTHGSATMQWRVVGVSQTRNNMDFAGTRVKLLITINETATQLEWGGATGV